MAKKKKPGRKTGKSARSQAAIRGWQTRRDNRAATSWREFGRDFPGYYHGVREEVHRAQHELWRRQREEREKEDRERRRRRGDEEDDYYEGPVWDDDWEWNY